MDAKTLDEWIVLSKGNKMRIQDRPLTELELDCIVLAQERLRKESVYLGLLEKRSHFEKEEYPLTDKAEALMVEYEIGWWDGKMFADVLKEKQGELHGQDTNKGT